MVTTSLSKIVDEINKKHGVKTMGNVKDIDLKETARISTGSPYIDWAVNGGFPLGRIVELYGNPSSGKSMIALRTIAEAQKKKMACVYIDAENAFSPEFAQKLGVNMKDLVVTQIQNGEDVFDLITALLETEVKCIVIDSVAALIPTYEEQEEMAKMTIGLHARLMSKGVRKIIAKATKNNTLLIFINQIREKMGAYGNPEITTGGRALAFYSSIRMEVRRGDFITENKQNIGQELKFKVTKSKVSPPFRNGVINFMYINGANKIFDDIQELVSVLLVHGKIQQRGPFYYVNEESFKGRKQLEEKINEDKLFKDKLLTLV